MKVPSDDVETPDKWSEAAPILLDLPADFDVTDHAMPLKRAEITLGIKEKAMFWMKSYYLNRTQCVERLGIRIFIVKLLWDLS